MRLKLIENFDFLFGISLFSKKFYLFSILYFQLLFILIITGCFNKTIFNKYQILEDGICVEIPADSVSSTRYTSDNKLYKGGDNFLITYKYIDTNGAELLFMKESSDWNNKNWRFCKPDSINNLTITKITMNVFDDSKILLDKFKDYNQTVIQYSFLNRNDSLFCKSMTGLIENKKNIWFHPPREYLFKILEINPFPFVQTPLKNSKKWQWQLTIGNFWGDARWKEWEGKIKNNIEYEIKGKKKVSTQFYTDEICYVVESVAKSPIGNTYLTAYFSKRQGFIKLIYKNIDQSRLILEIKRDDSNNK